MPLGIVNTVCVNLLVTGSAQDHSILQQSSYKEAMTFTLSSMNVKASPLWH